MSNTMEYILLIWGSIAIVTVEVSLVHLDIDDIKAWQGIILFILAAPIVVPALVLIGILAPFLDKP